MKHDYEIRAQEFIKKVFPFIEDDLFNPNFIEDAIADFNDKCHRKVIVSYGEARIALITSDYVVKFDYDDDTIEEIGGCENEIELYAQAVEDGFDYLFAKISRYNYAGYSFYIMPRIYHIGECRRLFNYADEYMTDEEQKWCESHNLTDLHCNNYGFRKCKVCIVDYAYIEHEYEWEDSISSRSNH